MRYCIKKISWLMCLSVFLGVASPAVADKDDHFSEKALQQLHEKHEREERELKRLSEMVLIPAGEFVMGRNGVNANEEPAHPVYLDAFYMDKYEVTQLQYLNLTGTNPSYFAKCPLCPVEKVTYQQALKFCSKMGKRLPTEAEWEKAARGETTGWYFWDRDIIDLYAWYGNNAGKRTRPVGTRNPNRYGLYDMAGNVWEWVQDWYQPDYYSKTLQRNPKGSKTGTAKVIRGGSWGNTQEQIVHAYRDSREPNTRYINGGFRCAKDAKGK
ncbi:MAG: formylglycine-generating enzyme family protein [Nitrospinota bacterium]|nr:formylglycine-generating enzyme family protein [Nitrospinota bacterium]